VIVDDVEETLVVMFKQCCFLNEKRDKRTGETEEEVVELIEERDVVRKQFEAVQVTLDSCKNRSRQQMTEPETEDSPLAEVIVTIEKRLDERLQWLSDACIQQLESMAKLDSIDEEERAMVAKKIQLQLRIDEGDRHIEANRIANERMRLEIAAKEKQTAEVKRQSSILRRQAVAKAAEKINLAKEADAIEEQVDPLLAAKWESIEGLMRGSGANESDSGKGKTGKKRNKKK
jgi:hypothetical protein